MRDALAAVDRDEKTLVFCARTPLFPMVLVANEVMQEGLDLHPHCRRVVHHDLAWNPAQLELRVGRVDRLGSLVQRLRERWLELLLGAAPRIDEYGLTDDPPEPPPRAFAEALRVELGPDRGPG